MAEAMKRNIPILRLNDHSLVQLGWGLHQQRIQATVSGKTSSIGLQTFVPSTAQLPTET